MSRAETYVTKHDDGCKIIHEISKAGGAQRLTLIYQHCLVAYCGVAAALLLLLYD